MSEKKASEENNGSGTEQEPEEKSRTDSIKGGIRQGLSMLNAMKDAIEETLSEARERGDLTPERAKEVMRSTLEKAQARAGEAREAFDFVKQKDFDGLKGVVDGIKEKVKGIERSLGLEVEEASEQQAEDEGDA